MRSAMRGGLVAAVWVATSSSAVVAFGSPRPQTGRYGRNLVVVKTGGWGGSPMPKLGDDEYFRGEREFFDADRISEFTSEEADDDIMSYIRSQQKELIDKQKQELYAVAEFAGIKVRRRRDEKFDMEEDAENGIDRDDLDVSVQWEEGDSLFQNNLSNNPIPDVVGGLDDAGWIGGGLEYADDEDA
eukprot:scaffold6979_cov56-Attheya_sp.AAC.3